MAETVRRLSCVQLDSIATVDRSHRLVLASRVGAVPRGTTSALLAGGRLFEYWAHEACLLHVEEWPLFRRRMREYRVHRWWGPVIDSQPELAARVLAEVRERGPLGSADFDGAGGGGMWNLKPEKRMLDALWTAGELVIAGRRGFQRLYDLPERVLPDEVLGQPEPTEAEWLRGLILRAVRGRGALTEAGVREHFRLKGGARADAAARGGAARGRARSGASRSTTAAPTCSFRRTRSSTAHRAAPCCCRRSRTCSGTGRSPSGCSASGT